MPHPPVRFCRYTGCLRSGNLYGYLYSAPTVASVTVSGETTYYNTIEAAFAAANSSVTYDPTITLLRDASTTTTTFISYCCRMYPLRHTRPIITRIPKTVRLTSTDIHYPVLRHRRCFISMQISPLLLQTSQKANQALCTWNPQVQTTDGVYMWQTVIFKWMPVLYPCIQKQINSTKLSALIRLPVPSL